MPAEPDRRYRLRLDPVQETLVIPLYGRAVETAKPRGVLRDGKAARIVASIDYDFARFDGGPSLLGTVLRTRILDTWTRQFLTDHPAGLSSRFERLGTGTCRWFDLDLPDVIDLRRQFFTDRPPAHDRRPGTGPVLDGRRRQGTRAVPVPRRRRTGGIPGPRTHEAPHLPLKRQVVSADHSRWTVDRLGTGGGVS